MTTAYDFAAETLQGQESDLSEYRGRVSLFVNTASHCGFTPQYEALEGLYRRYRDRGFVVLGFPCNQFGAQEPGTADEIGSFCTSRYGVDFPMFAKVDVNGDGAHPLWKHLTSNKKGLFGTEAIKWNFTKFLVDRDGHVVGRYAPTTKPEDIADDIEKLL